VSGAILHGLDGVMGLSGWQWLFISEGLPSAVIGVVAYFTLADSPETARWLTLRQVGIITRELEAERTGKGSHRPSDFGAALRDKRLYVLAAMSVALIAGGAGIPLWLPTIIRQSGVTNVWTIGLMAAIPYIVAVFVQQIIARHSDRTQERRWHAALPTLACALGWVLLAEFNSNPWISLFLLTVMTAGYLGATGPYWTMPALYLSGSAAAAGIAVITTAGGIGAFFAPTIVGWIASQTGTLSIGLVFYGVIMAVGAILLLLGTKPQTGLARSVPASVPAAKSA
jgi:nitrate/nitrite transporter NarK